MDTILQPYPEYRNTGLPWLKQVPAHWDLIRMKHLFTERVDKGHPNEPLLSATQSKGVVRQDKYEDRTMVATKNFESLKLVKRGDFVISLRSFEGGIEKAHDQGIISSAYTVLRPGKQANRGFFGHFFKSKPFIDGLSLYVTGIRDGQNINYSKLSRSDLPVPPPAEQRRIAHFLDTYTARTDRLIRAKERLIELLEEQKQAIIQRAVTRGLNPDVAMKDSGVSWFNEIPEGWEVLSVRRLSNFITSGSRGWSQYYSDTGDLFIQSGNLDRLMTFDFSSVQHVQPPSGAEGKRTKVQRNDILICITGALTGNTVLVDVDLPTAYVNQHVALVRPKKEMVAPRFLAYCLHSQAGKQQFKMNEYGGTKKGLGLDDVKSTVVPVPSRAIQREIVTFLDERLATLKETVDATQREITLIREYRTRLIADVVTGKLDVREAEAAHAAAEPSAHAPANQDAHLSPSAA